ncbi:MAG TPA: carboxypeptidase regulatory-like domain-containing protein [Terriglobales bacterium]|nr:carboxypeptidase regulatory-like domain-containing protein [Terriglobales bacterium]
MPDNSEVVVWLSPLDSSVAQSRTKPSRHYQMLQRNKHFKPALLVIPVGTVVEFPNKDPWFHNVFSLYQGKKFDLGLYQAGSTHSVHFDRLGASYIFCNIHPQMSAVVLAIDSEYYAISDPSGKVTLEDIPPGQYHLRVWYQGASQKALDALQRDITVTSGRRDLGVLKVTANPAAQVAHKNKYGQDYDPDGATPSY